MVPSPSPLWWVRNYNIHLPWDEKKANRSDLVIHARLAYVEKTLLERFLEAKDLNHDYLEWREHLRDG